MTLYAILACDDEWGIGKNNALPWPKNPADLKWFKECTKDTVVIMGRSTWDSPDMPTPLPNRENIVVSSNPGIEGPCMVVTMVAVKKLIADFKKTDKQVWIIGGAKLVEGLLSRIDEIWISRIEGNYDCDVLLPKNTILNNFNKHSVENPQGLNIEKWLKS